ncbi:hypothetical protein AC622_06125 [Bacillus sp. FJAT-27916]|uniref:STAS domain-containing protein n=1 Tax=Bacillus sp. FJAT-27916 TaxID=1679169 RepID=UPI0006707F63|nr:STAS domain-containing protein [Bacillus sp. FJAT-27916]KMY43880.1 hypothetical protein AC622_06125 [Bacillus sp. FJAT-27916]
MDSILDQAQISLLNAIGENLFICDEQYQIILLNDYSNHLIKKLEPFTGLSSKEEYIGKSICDLDPNEGQALKAAIEAGIFPVEAKITLYHKWAANMTVNRWKNGLNQSIYIITWKDITDYEEELHKGYALLEELYAPVIQTILDDVILMPITGTMTRNRLDKIKEIALFESANRLASYLIIDFTGMTVLDDDSITMELETICRSLNFIGTTVIYSGLSAKFVQQIIGQGTSIPTETFATFRQAIRYACKEKGFKLVHV